MRPPRNQEIYTSPQRACRSTTPEASMVAGREGVKEEW